MWGAGHFPLRIFSRILNNHPQRNFSDEGDAINQNNN